MALSSDVKNAIASDQELTDVHINLFLRLLSRHTPFTPQNVLFYQIPSNYQAVLTDDMEILYDGKIRKEKYEEEKIGHYTCVMYSHREQAVSIYDSSNRNFLSEEHEHIIRKLYPNKKEIIFKNVMQQPDNKSCGIFAIAFATSLALHRDPVNEQYLLGDRDSTIPMRLHFISMLENDDLLPFPTTSHLLIKKRGRPKKQKVGRPPSSTLSQRIKKNRENVARSQTENPEKHRKRVAKYQKKNPEKHQESVAKYQKKNVLKHQNSVSKYQKNHKNEMAEKVARHRVKKIGDMCLDKISEISLKSLKLGENSCFCKICGAKFFEEEITRKEWCCGQGKYFLGNLPPLSGDFYKSKQFLDSARKYNNLFAFSSLGVSGEFIKNDCGPSLVKIQGRTYHLLCNLNTNGPINNVVLYIDDGSMRSEKASELKVDKSIFDSIQNYLNDVSPVVPLLKKLADCPAEKARIVFENTSRNIHGPVLGDKPKIEELAGILKFDDSSEPRQVVIWKKGDNKPSAVSIFSPVYESLQYPLLFPQGTFGWYPGLAGPKTLKISQTKYYRLNLLSDCDSRFTGFKRLSQEYFVDMWSRAEEEKLLWVKREQAKILRMATRDEFDETVVGQNGIPIGRIYLPNSFTNSPRNMQIKYMDAMAIVTRLGRPSFFITMTCNPKWPEIESNLREFERSTDRPDLCNRVFQLKLIKLLQILRSGQLFGKMTSLLWVIEFQKRGLPHAHIALRVEGGGPTDAKDIDKFVRADFPIENKKLCDIVIKHMIHGPCGSEMPKTPCYDFSTHKCSKKFPKPFNDQTYVDDFGYVHYKRPQGVTVKGKNKRDIDTRWIVPYNPQLLMMFNCHINVEIASSVKVVKYLFKYIHKGPDKAKVAVTDKENVDEIEEYVSLRYISASEAMWRIFEFDMSGRTPAVNSLPLHLPNKDTIIFEPGKEDDAKKKSISKLCLYFLRPKNDEMSKLTYLDFYEIFIIHTTKPKSDCIALGSKRHWITKRKRGECVARLHWISPSLGELFYLRLLLSRFPAYDFEQLRTVNNEVFESFQEAAEARGLIDDNENFMSTMQEAVGFMLGSGLRQLFVCLIVVGAPAKILWEGYLEQLSEDFLSKPNSSRPEALNKTLLEMDRKLRLHGKSCEDVGLPKPTATDTEVDRELLKWDTSVCENVMDEWVPKLTKEQATIFHKICTNFTADISQRVFFLDGPGGSGKTTLIKVICAYYRSKKNIVLCTASTGVAALNYEGGVTAHSMFKLPFDNEREKYCTLSSTSQRAELLRSATLLIWDEASMARKEQIETLNRTLQDFMGNKKFFGGKLVLFAGDFRQIPPVIKYGTPQDVILASMKNSFLWPQIQTLRLTQSQRSIRDPEYSSYIMKVGNDEIYGEKFDENVEQSSIKIIPLSYVQTVDTLEDLIEWVFPSDVLQNRMQCLHRAILSGTNSNIDQINELVLNQLPGSIIEVLSSDSLKMSDDSKKNTSKNSKTSNEANFYNDLLNTFSEPGVPNHKLRLKVGCQCIVMRNLSFDDGLVNGSKVYIDKIGKYTIQASLFDEKLKGFRTVCIPRIPFIFSTGPNGMEIVRKQFPLRLSYGLTINKSQGQTLDMVGVDLRSDVFCHGQLYVALSRVRSRHTIRVLLPHHRYLDGEPHVANIVYKTLLK